jgi:glycerol-3-phosphate acyltransferase PlsY
MPLLVTLFSKKPEIVAMTIIIAAIVIYKHKENIKRLRAGTESRFKA